MGQAINGGFGGSGGSADGGEFAYTWKKQITEWNTFTPSSSNVYGFLKCVYDEDEDDYYAAAKVKFYIAPNTNGQPNLTNVVTIPAGSYPYISNYWITTDSSLNGPWYRVNGYQSPTRWNKDSDLYIVTNIAGRYSLTTKAFYSSNTDNSYPADDGYTYVKVDY